MRIVLNHITRMDAPRICIAGIDPATGRHLRPIADRDRTFTRRLLVQEGGRLSLGTMIELPHAVPDPQPPAVEDHRFPAGTVRVVGQVSPRRYLQLLRTYAAGTLTAIFGEDLQPLGRGYAVDKGHGDASLGVLRVRRRPDLVIDEHGKLRMRLRLGARGSHSASLSVTDVRFVQADHKTLREDLVADVRARLRRGVEVWAMLGLARAYRPKPEDPERHWLQVNGLCLADRPLGEEP